MTDPESAPQPLEATGERLVPESFGGELVLAEHVARYALATRLARGRRVLDAACGEGYGCAMLAAAGAASVVGVDADAATVDHARRRYGVNARTGHVEGLDLPDDAVDLLVSFETIEHVAQPDLALDEFARVLATTGALLISTPNADQYLEDNPFHQREFTSREFLEALRERFAAVRPLYQQTYLSSAILDAAMLGLADRDTALALEARKLAAVEPGAELYTLALCGHEELPALDANVVGLASVYEAHELAQLLRRWQERAAAAERNQSDWEARAREAERQRTAWEGRATTAEHNQREWQDRAEEAERQADELRREVDEITTSLSWRMTRPLRTAKGRLR